MPSYLSPGVYVEEVSGGIKPIAGVGTSTAAFGGIANKGPVGEAKLVTNWTQFVKEFGDIIPDRYLAYGVYSFFAEGGTICYIVRVATANAKPASIPTGTTGIDTILAVTAKSEGTWGNNIKVIIGDPSDKPSDTHFKLSIEYEGEVVEEYDNLSNADLEGEIDSSNYIKVDVTDLTKRPTNGSYDFQGGDDGVENISDGDFLRGLSAFDKVDDINIVLIPDRAGGKDLITQALNYCKNRKDCFFIADPPRELDPQGIADFKKGLNSSYGALYYPWVYISDPLTGKRKLVPPSGVVAGTYAYTDSARGVHKAPAGIAEGHLDSVVGVESIITKGEHDTLNPLGINVIRSFPSAGICIWGARTLSADAEWRYINVRRLLLFIEESIDEGTQWVVFEPNDPSLWGKVNRNITAFLLRVWRDGALFGITPDQAFFVKVDAENNPPEVVDAGQLIIEVGVAPVKPAEFVIIRIQQKTLKKG